MDHKALWPQPWFGELGLSQRLAKDELPLPFTVGEKSSTGPAAWGLGKRA